MCYIRKKKKTFVPRPAFTKYKMLISLLTIQQISEQSNHLHCVNFLVLLASLPLFYVKQTNQVAPRNKHKMFVRKRHFCNSRPALTTLNVTSLLTVQQISEQSNQHHCINFLILFASLPFSFMLSKLIR